MNRKEAVVIAIILFLSVIAWIGFDLFHASSQTTITPEQEQAVEPLTPQFDNDIIRELQTRED